jgi:hypothetical protein
MIRGCTFENVRIGVADGVTARRIGAVDSTFSPALDPSIPTVQPTSESGACAVELAGELLCDTRALCEGMPAGGVRCSCVGAGLRYKPGVPEDGRQCEQDAKLSAKLESQSLAISVSKPSNRTNQTMQLIVEAEGEAELTLAFHATMTRESREASYNESVRIDQPLVSAFGHHIEWKQLPPSATWLADLDGNKLKFVDTKRYEFGVHLACESDQQSCAADGDLITTVLQLGSQGTSGRLRSEVTLQTRVEALVSCNDTAAWVTSSGLDLTDGTILAESSVEVRLRAVDVDGLDTKFTRAEIFLNLTDANRRESKFPFNTEIGSNAYTTVVAGAWTKEPGRYTLVVSVPKWPTGSCEILRRSITVTADTTQLILALVLIGVLLGVCALGSYLLYKNRERAMNFLLSFLSYEVTIAADIVLEMWDFAGMRNVPLPGG